MARPPKVDHLREKLMKAIVSAEKLYDAVHQVSGINPAIARPTLHAQHVRRVVELAFMGVVESWEEFLELTLVRYVAGARCRNGYAPSLRLDKADSLAHAYKLVTGNPQFDPARGFIARRSAQSTMDIARVFFRGGHPYVSALDSMKDRLKDANWLRNRVAHSSEKCRTDFQKAARRLRNRSGLRQGYGVGHLLEENPVAHFGPGTQASLTIFHAYMAMYRRLATQIVPT